MPVFWELSSRQEEEVFLGDIISSLEMKGREK
jgi:hypothetical protein